ncbi:MAG: DNA-binding XRE family transcriptional regulator [Paraglaciecola sp.]|jgi:DNA-binding XRE family transcriptional regulator
MDNLVVSKIIGCRIFMKINANLVIDLRNKKSWSQDELSIATGLNLRTIQRIENEASASLQSKKALASVFDINIHDLDYEEIVKMKQYEYKTLEIENKEGFLTGIKKSKLPDFAEIFNEEGKQGWLVIQILTPELAQNMWSAKTGNMVALLQREVVQ